MLNPKLKPRKFLLRKKKLKKMKEKNHKRDEDDKWYWKIYSESIYWFIGIFIYQIKLEINDLWTVCT